MAVLLESADIMVTARRAEGSAAPSVVAQAEGLGDLKLYRIPVPVTLAARSQKQVAFMVKDRVRGEVIYRTSIDREPDEVRMLFRFRNRKADGMGDPLPAGKAVLYQHGEHGRSLVGEATTPDKAVDEEVDLVFARATDVTIETEAPEGDENRRIVTIRNANPFPVRFEAEFPNSPHFDYFGLPRGLVRKPGKRVWRTTIPANDTARLSYRIDERDDD